MMDGDCWDLDIVDLIHTHAARHGLSEESTDSLLKELDKSAAGLKIEVDSLYMILLDTISGQFVGTKEDIIHQIKVMLDNHNVLKCFPI